MTPKPVLVIDPSPLWREVKTDLKRTCQAEVMQVAHGEAGLDLLREQTFAALFLAENLVHPPSPPGLAHFKQEFPSLPVFVVSLRPTVAGAVSAMREGAQDYLGFPPPPDRLAELLAAYLRPLPETLLPAASKAAEHQKPRTLITQDAAMLRILQLAKAVAPTRATVLIQGDSGTGKEVLARFLHQESDRSQGPFIAVNCAALPEGLLESELFGHEKGAFTGAISRKLGKFELAHHGTLLLDEISEMQPHLQAKLLRVLQENEIDRVGGRQPIAIDARVVATTNRDLAELIKKGEFREDLYYRLQVIALTLPPLSARPGDIPLLAEYFLAHYAQLFGKERLQFTTATLKALEAASWPGNVRQLENAVARGVLLATSRYVHPRDIFGELPLLSGQGASLPPPGGAKPTTLREMEQNLIFQALNETSGNRTHAAKLLGISVRTLRNKLHEYRQEQLGATACRSQVA
jgi:two-component system response regulator FlrC